MQYILFQNTAMNLNFENKIKSCVKPYFGFITSSCLFNLDCKVEFILFEFPLKYSKKEYEISRFYT